MLMIRSTTLQRAMTTAPAVELVGLFSPNNASLDDVGLIGWGTELEAIIDSQRPSSPPGPSSSSVSFREICSIGLPNPNVHPGSHRLAKHSDPRERPGRSNHIFTTRGMLLNRFPEPSALDETEASIIQVSCRASILVDTGGNGDMEASMALIKAKSRVYGTK